MAQVVFNKNSKEVIIGVGNKVIFVENKSQQIKQELFLPENLVALLIPLNKENVAEVPQSSSKEKETKHGHITTSVQDIQVSPNGQFLAVTTNNFKSVILYGLKDIYEILSVRETSRISSTINFSPNSLNLLVCDKSGDCYLYDCSDFKTPGKFILGHLSSIYDVRFSFDEKFILTSDRDEKIRVTNFPNSYEIEGYCLGHKEYVCGIEILENHPDLVVSLSGDKSIKIWKWKDGKKIAEINIPAPGIKLALKTLNQSSYAIMVLVYQPNESLFEYKMTVSSTDSVEVSFKSSHFLNSAIITNICYTDSFLIATIYNSERLNIETLDIGEKNDCNNNFRTLKESVENAFKDEKMSEPEDISEWFKKKFDNVSEYLERKKRRIDEKSSKKSMLMY